ncbi:MAG: asparaginase [FCB group bacterium]|nr:asparaginase [FCB group bacterium]
MDYSIKLFVTGGTFDKEYNELNGSLFFKNTHVSDMLQLGRSLLDIHVETLMMQDSLHMSDNQRNYILQRCAEEKSSKIVITHGTDTMTDTAALLGKTVPDKTIVLTGAMIPYCFSSSDGLFNLGSALSFVQVLPSGVYVAMNGQYFRWDNVRKNRRQGIFEQVGS